MKTNLTKFQARNMLACGLGSVCSRRSKYKLGKHGNFVFADDGVSQSFGTLIPHGWRILE